MMTGITKTINTFQRHTYWVDSFYSPGRVCNAQIGPYLTKNTFRAQNESTQSLARTSLKGGLVLCHWEHPLVKQTPIRTLKNPNRGYNTSPSITSAAVIKSKWTH